MTIDQWLKQAQHRLEQAGISTARLDALVMLNKTLDRDKAWLLSHSEVKISPRDQGILKNLLTQRIDHIPLAYLFGRTEFYGRDYKISPAVLEPRPESETMIDELKKLSLSPHQLRIADVGCGSGALGITAGLELANASLTLIDIDKKALEVARNNVDLFTMDAELRQQDILSGDTNNYTVLLCNLPYVPDDFKINRAAMHEPIIAIYGGPDGLDLYRRLFQQVKTRNSKPLYILCEALPPQHDQLQAIAAASNYQTTSKNDFIVVFKRTQKRANEAK